MQAASEMYAKVYNQVVDVSQAMDQHPAVKSAKQQLGYVLSKTQSLLESARIKGTLAAVGSAGVDAARLEPEAVSAPRWTVGVVMDLLYKLSTIPAYVTSTVRWATVLPASRVIEILQAGWKNIQQKVLGKEVPAIGEKRQGETRNGVSGESVADVGPAEAAGLSKAESAEVHARTAAGPSSVPEHNLHSSPTPSKADCVTERPIDKSPTKEKSEANTTAACPRSWLSSLMKRSAF